VLAQRCHHSLTGTLHPACVCERCQRKIAHSGDAVPVCNLSTGNAEERKRSWVAELPVGYFHAGMYTYNYVVDDVAVS
jgi:predicted amidophosphoribosyltransferase